MFDPVILSRHVVNAKYLQRAKGQSSSTEKPSQPQQQLQTFPYSVTATIILCNPKASRVKSTSVARSGRCASRPTTVRIRLRIWRIWLEIRLSSVPNISPGSELKEFIEQSYRTKFERDKRAGQNKNVHQLTTREKVLVIG